jgi:hypothetical protein
MRDLLYKALLGPLSILHIIGKEHNKLSLCEEAQKAIHQGFTSHACFAIKESLFSA